MTATLGPQTTMREVLEAFPGARRALFKHYHIGGCSSCGFAPEETLAQLCARNGNLDVAAVLARVHESHKHDQRLSVEPRELAEQLRSPTPPRVLDIRTREEWEAARIAGSVLFTQELMNEILGRWPRETAFVIVDHAGKTALDGAAYFLGHGYENVRALRGGVDAWSQEVDPSVPRYRLE